MAIMPNLKLQVTAIHKPSGDVMVAASSIYYTAYDFNFTVFMAIMYHDGPLI